jgi:hypothetical protein
MEAIMAKGRQLTDETHLERKTRSKGNFRACERNLPVIRSRFEIPLLDGIFSYLTYFGIRNPFASEANPSKQEVWLFDNYAYQPASGSAQTLPTWQAEFPVAYFKKNSGKDLSRLVASVADNIGLGYDDKEAQETIAQRLQPFAATIAPARFIRVTLPTGAVQKLGPGGPNAVSNQTVMDLGRYKDGDTAWTVTMPPELAPYGAMKMFFAAPEGWAVISDIDDTIKITMTPSPMGILRSTFVDTPTPIASMPRLYAHIDKIIQPAWFYLSASPYNLHPFLHNFIHAHYPPGPIFLREASWMELGGFLTSLTRGTQVYKRKRMEKIHSCLPRRKMICIGDSTQSDPEAYGDICRKFPGWVKAVFIRKVTDVAEMEGTGKNDDERFETAFRGVPREVWRTFEDPNELHEVVDGLKGL